ncbi:MAG: BA14K family protein [Rhizobium sp.]
MKSILTGLFLAACCLPLMMGACQIVSALGASQSRHEFTNLDSPLWTNTPIRIDRDHQAYQRLPTLLVAGSNMPSQTNEHAKVETGSFVAVNETQSQLVDAAQAHVSWCRERYSSYRVEDNTYQPFGGGPRQACRSPQTSSFETVAQTTAPQQTPQSQNAAHVRWCSSQHASYQPGDNSYRAFSGARRQCTSPFTGPEANSVQASM